MSNIYLESNASGTGTLTIASPNTNSNYTLTLPTETGTVLTSGGAIDVSESAPADSVVISSTGNVGIGTSSPSFKLQVNGFIGVTDGTSTVRLANSGGVGLVSTITNHPLAFQTNDVERMRIDTSGNISVIQSAGSYTCDVSQNTISVANTGTVDFANASGMLVVNSWTTGGVTLYLCGGGNTVAIGSVISQVGTLTYVAGIAGYRWTNNYGSTVTVSFFFVRTRNTA